MSLDKILLFGAFVYFAVQFLRLSRQINAVRYIIQLDLAVSEEQRDKLTQEFEEDNSMVRKTEISWILGAVLATALAVIFYG